MTPRRQLKQSLQKHIVDHLRWRAQPGVWWCHIPNGGLRSKAEAKIFAGLGVRASAPDLLIVPYGKPQFLEVKTPSGRVTPEQHACHEALSAVGACVAVVRTIDEAVAPPEFAFIWKRT
jgi:hypothetical protein